MKPLSLAAAFLLVTSAAVAQEPRLFAEPDAFKTLVNPMCSHCKDEAKRRAKDLKDDDRVLCWIRGYSDGGVIPYRFFLNPFRVISDTYGVFVYDPDAGYARGFAPSLDFTFHGWRNGVMVMKHKDGTLYSCLTGIAFEGPKKGEKLKAVPTLVSDWGHWLDTYPDAVAYHMFDKFQPVELSKQMNLSSHKSRVRTSTMLDDTRVFGVTAGKEARHYPLEILKEKRLIHDQLDGKPIVILWLDSTKTAAAYRPIASPPAKVKVSPRNVTLESVTFATKPHVFENGARAHPHPKAEWYNRTAPFYATEGGSHWDIAGRAVDGELKGWTLEWLDGVEVKWFAWTGEYPHSTAYEAKKKDAEKPNAKDAIKEIAGSAEFLRGVPKKFGKLQSVDAAKHTVTVTFEGDKEPTTWSLTPDAEIKVAGWWGRVNDLMPPTLRVNACHIEPRVWAWFKIDRAKKPVAIFMIADDLSEQDMHGDGLKIKSIGDKTIVFTFAKDKTREAPLEECKAIRDGKFADVKGLKVNDRVFLLSHATRTGCQHDLMDRATLEKHRGNQKDRLRQVWIKEGLPGAVGFLHVYAGEVDVILDHEAMRWGRSLQPGAKLELVAKPPINAVVKSVTAQREKTQVRLVVKSFDLAELSMGQRVNLKMPAPSAEVEKDAAPPGIDLLRTKEERIDWFLANIYCTCPVGGDGCTGHFYTLASCNPNACGAPNQTRKYIASKIDAGSTNREIFQAMLKDRGPTMLRPHLLP